MENYQDEVSVTLPKLIGKPEPEKTETNQLVENPFAKRTEQSANLNTNAGNVWSELPPSHPISKSPIVSSPDMALPNSRKNSVKNNHPLRKKLSSSDRDQQMPNMIFLKQVESKVFNEVAHKELNTQSQLKARILQISRAMPTTGKDFRRTRRP